MIASDPQSARLLDLLARHGRNLQPTPQGGKNRRLKNGFTGPVYRTPLQKFDAGIVPGRRQAMERNSGVEMMHEVKILSQEQPG